MCVLSDLAMVPEVRLPGCLSPKMCAMFQKVICTVLTAMVLVSLAGLPSERGQHQRGQRRAGRAGV